MLNHEFSSSFALKMGRREESYNNSNKHIINIQFGEILFRWHDEVEKTHNIITKKENKRTAQRKRMKISPWPRICRQSRVALRIFKKNIATFNKRFCFENNRIHLLSICTYIYGHIVCFLCTEKRRRKNTKFDINITDVSHSFSRQRELETRLVEFLRKFMKKVI